MATKYGMQGMPLEKFFWKDKEFGEMIRYVPQYALKKEIEDVDKSTTNCFANIFYNVSIEYNKT